MAIRLSHKQMQALDLKGIDPSAPKERKPKKRSKRGNPETPIVAACLEFLRAAGIYAWRNNTVGVFDPSRGAFRKNKGQLNGVSDILGVMPGGRFLAVEVKAGKNKPSDNQKAFLAEVERHGGVALTVWSVDELVAAMRKERG